MSSPDKRPRHRHRHLDRLGQDYCQTLEEMQDLCERLGLNFRSEMMALAERWIAEHTHPNADSPGTSLDHDHQARPTR
ncbi:MAG: hypothetical protein AAGA29_05895 [Planctomycetota bacterium]